MSPIDGQPRRCARRDALCEQIAAFRSLREALGRLATDADADARRVGEAWGAALGAAAAAELNLAPDTKLAARDAEVLFARGTEAWLRLVEKSCRETARAPGTTAAVDPSVITLLADICHEGRRVLVDGDSRRLESMTAMTEKIRAVLQGDRRSEETT